MARPRPGTLPALVLTVLLLSTAPVAAEDPPSLPGVDLSPLTPAQQQTAMKIFRENGCTCGCGMTVADCRVKDPNCGTSPRLAAQVVQQLAAGVSADQVVKAVFASKPARPATPAARAAGKTNLEFDVPVDADDHAVGPADAPVTLVTWLDYQ